MSFLTRRRMLAAAGIAGAALTAAALTLALNAPSGPRPVGDAVQGPKTPAARVTDPAGHVVTCPLGAVPTVNITEAYFRPRLRDGAEFRAHVAYRVLLTGTVANETTAAIIVAAVLPQAGRGRWAGAQVRAPATLAANRSGRLRVAGVFRPTRTGPARLGAKLSWHWSQARLADCGARGLIDDD